MVWRGSGIYGELSEDGRWLRLTRPLWVPLPIGNPLCNRYPTGFHVPEGFETDFASIPRFFWRVLPPTGKYSAAAVSHDYLYQFNGCSRAAADWVFARRMEDLGVNPWIKQAMWAAVRVFGWRAWNRYRKGEK